MMIRAYQGSILKLYYVCIMRQTQQCYCSEFFPHSNLSATFVFSLPRPMEAFRIQTAHRLTGQRRLASLSCSGSACVFRSFSNSERLDYVPHNRRGSMAVGARVKKSKQIDKHLQTPDKCKWRAWWQRIAKRDNGTLHETASTRCCALLCIKHSTASSQKLFNDDNKCAVHNTNVWPLCDKEKSPLLSATLLSV